MSKQKRDIMPVSPDAYYRTLAENMEFVGRFAGNLAHDFNNILSGVLGYASYVKMKMAPTEKLYADLVMIEQSAERAVELTRKLMAFAPGRYAAGERLDIRRAASDAAGKIRDVTPPGLSFEYHFEEGLPPVAGDMAHMTVALQSLCMNAVEAMAGREGVILISAKRHVIQPSERARFVRLQDPECLALSIQDSGRGMSQETKERLFEPFYSTRNPRKGAGLGLAIVYGIVAAHRGDIFFESEEGKGATFTIYLPFAKPA